MFSRIKDRFFSKPPSKDFARAVIKGNHARAWELLSEQSKREVVEAVARQVPRSTTESVRNDFDHDYFCIRDTFFKGLKSVALEPLKAIYKADHRVVELSENTGTVFVDIDEGREVYKILKEDGIWKIDFFGFFHQLPIEHI